MSLEAAKNSPRCTKTTRNGENAGNRCKNPALVGTNLCRKHGGSLPQQQQKRELELSRRRASIKPIERTDARGRGDSALGEELRRTVAWIDYCESELQALGVPYDDEDPAPGVTAVLESFGVVKRETIGASEFEGTNETALPKVAIWEERLRWNRQHLAALTKQWLAAGFEAKRLELARDTIERMERLVNGVARDLGHNASDPDVRRIVRDRIRRELESDGDAI